MSQTQTSFTTLYDFIPATTYMYFYFWYFINGWCYIFLNILLNATKSNFMPNRTLGESNAVADAEKSKYTVGADGNGFKLKKEN